MFNADAVGGLPTNETTIAKALKSAGYATKAVGKWHLGQRPGYTLHMDLTSTTGFRILTIWVLLRGGTISLLTGHHYPYSMSSADAEKVNILEQPTDLNLLTGRYVQESMLDFIRKSTREKVPFFLYMAFNHVHVPDFANQQFCNSTLRGRFGDALAEMDDAVGKILNFLYSIKAEENTIVFFTSDNGPWLIKSEAGGVSGLLRGGKQTTWEGGVREPGIVSWPGKIKEGWIIAFRSYHL